MTSSLRIEFATLGPAHSIIEALHGEAVLLDATAVATEAASRPVAPAFGTGTSGYAIVRCLASSTGAIAIAWGDDPTATEAHGKYLAPGEEIALLIETGQKLSVIEVA